MCDPTLSVLKNIYCMTLSIYYLSNWQQFCLMLIELMDYFFVTTSCWISYGIMGIMVIEYLAIELDRSFAFSTNK